MCEYLTGVAGGVLSKWKHHFHSQTLFFSHQLSGPHRDEKQPPIEREMAGAELHACVWMYLCFWVKGMGSKLNEVKVLHTKSCSQYVWLLKKVAFIFIIIIIIIIIHIPILIDHRSKCLRYIGRNRGGTSTSTSTLTPPVTSCFFFLWIAIKWQGFSEPSPPGDLAPFVLVWRVNHHQAIWGAVLLEFSRSYPRSSRRSVTVDTMIEFCLSARSPFFCLYFSRRTWTRKAPAKQASAFSPRLCCRVDPIEATPLLSAITLNRFSLIPWTATVPWLNG